VVYHSTTYHSQWVPMHACSAAQLVVYTPMHACNRRAAAVCQPPRTNALCSAPTVRPRHDVDTGTAKSASYADCAVSCAGEAEAAGHVAPCTRGCSACSPALFRLRRYCLCLLIL